MIGLVALLVVLGLVFVLLRHTSRREARLKRHREQAAQVIDRQARAARRAMNDASGQSWRNLAD